MQQLDPQILAALLPIVLLGLAFDIWVVRDIVRGPAPRHLPAWAWITFTIVSTPGGGLFYLLLGRAPR